MAQTTDSKAHRTLTEISGKAFAPENQVMEELLRSVAPLADLDHAITTQSADLTRSIREQGLGHGVEAFLHAYGLDTKEGVALMCLAEALLRIPDSDSADALIRDTFEGRDWRRYTGTADSWLVNMSSWGLLMTGKVVDYGADPRPGIGKVIKGMVARTGEPVIREALRKAMKLIGSQFVLGEDVKEALKHSSHYEKKGYRFSYDILGEGARSDAQAQAYVDSYLDGIEKIGKTVRKGTSLFEAPGISIKLSALHARYQLVKRDRVMQELLPRLRSICLAAKKAGVAISLDAEEAARLDIELEVFQALMADPEFAKWNGIGFVLQAYQKRAFYLIDWLVEQAQKTGRIIPVRLVKGAYWDSEIKWAQMGGLPSYPVFTRKYHTDVSYLACANKLLQHRDSFYPQFATHNIRTVVSIKLLAQRHGWGTNQFEYQRLYGMGEALHDRLLADTPSRVYAPVGAHKDLLAYLIRRLLENGANSSFVHLLMDERKTAEEIVVDPVAWTKQQATLYNTSIPAPEDIYGPVRKNSEGLDFGNCGHLHDLKESLAPYAQQAVPKLREQSQSDVDAAITRAQKAFSAWSQRPVEERAAIIAKAGDLMQEHLHELMALCANEAGKVLVDGVAEVREAVDFCRYYAAEAIRIMQPDALTSPAGESNVLRLHAKGVFACISPWNFPLAIFTGQVAAALVTGNCVVAKPAEQTPAIAKRAVELLHQAGVPNDVLQLVCGFGETVGAALVNDKRIAGVVFTGSVETAHIIQKSLSARGGAIIPLIAETGGMNCMVVDSSALHEQAIDDIVLSAFGSAGQRCSALRVLYVQEEIADHLLALLSGAMQELKLGNPLKPDTDIGPVIDADAQEQLIAHIEHLKTTARFIASAPAPEGDYAKTRHFVIPHAFEIKDIRQLHREVFGPVLHVIRYAHKKLPEVIDAINGTGYGLTFGVHSRIEDHVELLCNSIHAGNIYVNRSMIGATVGVQPFGGEGLSGTGPKAGGPHYLLRFVNERTVTVNTAAIGGNVSLLNS